jgi:hypothetical protein
MVEQSLRHLVPPIECLQIFLRFLQTLVRIEKPERRFDLAWARHSREILGDTTLIPGPLLLTLFTSAGSLASLIVESCCTQ